MAIKKLEEIRQNTVDSSEILYFVKVPDDVSSWDTKSLHMALLMASSNSMDSGIETDEKQQWANVM